ncbi:MAG: hypothetical protein Q4B65_01710 [Candidatus Saccharibacteria bacterium]|nr:hypothetical protein [Candidatus Saccharibacteria bacterium]
MLKIVVFDSGYGGELFADYLEKELGVVEIIRVIDWRNAKIFLENPREARKKAEAALRPYLNEVDLIFFANHLLSITSLKYFRRRYKNQKFLALKLPNPKNYQASHTLILTTKLLTKTISFHNYLFRFKAEKKVLALDSWPTLIDDGELTRDEILTKLYPLKSFDPETIILACSQFGDIKSELKLAFNKNLKILDSFEDSSREICKVLKIRGGLGKRK